MFDINTIPCTEKKRITDTLLKWGIAINQVNGTIDYVDTIAPKLKCKSIHLIRHAETIAVAKHEFMSDTSSNCVFTEHGKALAYEQAAELDRYNFDIALYGPIERVVNTKKLIMEAPQKFECVRLECLHGIDNTGWEYKTYFDLAQDPLFIAREVELNMFARTPYGSSWGTVIANCADTLDYINENCADMDVLLISQGSVLRGMQILLKKREHPWDDYTASGMYNIGDNAKSTKNYGIIIKVY